MSMHHEKVERKVRRGWERERVATVITGESKTQQSHAASVDVNNIIKRFERTGVMPTGLSPGQYGDVSDLNAPLGELIESSKATLGAAGVALEEHNTKVAKEQADAAALEKAELEELRKSKKTSIPPE